MLSSLRNGTEKLIPKYFPDLMNSTRRIEFLPVEWRTDLQLDGGKHGINTIRWQIRSHISLLISGNTFVYIFPSYSYIIQQF